MSSGKKVKGYDPKDYEVVDVTIPVAALVDRGQLVISREVHKVSCSLCPISILYAGTIIN